MERLRNTSFNRAVGSAWFSPVRQILSEETAVENASTWQFIPLSPSGLFSPNRAAVSRGTPSRENASIWTPLSPLCGNWSRFIASPMRALIQQSPQRPKSDFPNTVNDVLASSSLVPRSSIPPSGPKPARTENKFSTALPPSLSKERKRPYKRRLHASDIAAAADQLSLSRRRERDKENLADNGRDFSSTIKPPSTGSTAPRIKRIRFQDAYGRIFPEEEADSKGVTDQATTVFEDPAVVRETVMENRLSPYETPLTNSRTPASDSSGKKCNCKKSQCLKLYCECFKAGATCGPDCRCENCKNSDENTVDIEEAVRLTLERNPLAFDPKIQVMSNVTTADGQKLTVESHQRGCNCRKSGCQKKYCECFYAGVPCGAKCKCQSCKNCDPNLTGTLSIKNDHESPLKRSSLARRLDFDDVDVHPMPVSRGGRHTFML